MSQRKVTQTEREQIYLKKMAGQTLPEIAQVLSLSKASVRKWWRRGRDEGLFGLVERKHGRPAQGILSQFATEVRQASVQLKRDHKRWGANRVLVEMGNNPAFGGLPLPSRSRLYAYFHQECADCLNIWTQHIQVPVPALATAVHEVWQVDHQEGHRLGDESMATVCNIRDPYGAAILLAKPFRSKPSCIGAS